MKGHTGMYIILALLGVAFLSRPAAASGEMVAAGSVASNLGGVLTGQYAQAGGQKGSFSVSSPSGTNQTFSLG